MSDYNHLIQQLLHSGQADINQIGLLRLPATAGHPNWEELSLKEKQAILGNRRSPMLNIYQKLCQIQSQTGKINKSELNKFGNYKYFTEQQALNILKPLLAKQKLTLTFSDTPGEVITEKTEKEWMVRYGKQAILTNSESPEEQLIFHYWAMGSNTDPAKAKGCAETYAIKYFLTKFFLIPTTDELDPDITKQTEYLNRLANGKQETAEQIRTRHRDRDLDAIIKKHGLRYQTTPEYRQWKENYGVSNHPSKEVSHE